MNIPDREKFQSLLRELFEPDCADLDFGIYRIMNRRREAIDRFITEDLPKIIDEEIQNVMLTIHGISEHT